MKLPFCFKVRPQIHSSEFVITFLANFKRWTFQDLHQMHRFLSFLLIDKYLRIKKTPTPTNLILISGESILCYFSM